MAAVLMAKDGGGVDGGGGGRGAALCSCQTFSS
jgi:hypothetical protein